MTPAERRYLDFQLSYKPRDWEVNGVRWMGFLSNVPGPPVLILNGSSSEGDSYFPLFASLASTNRPLAPTLPLAIDTMSAAVDGLIGLLDRFLIGRVHVLGHAMGGYLAQHLVRRAPSRVSSLTLAATATPNPRDLTRVQEAMRKASRTPEMLLRWNMINGVRQTVGDQLRALPEDDRRFWGDYLARDLRLPELKTRLASEYRLRLDYHRGTRFSVDDLRTWKGEVTLFRFERNGAIQSDNERQLAEIYPGATWIDLPGAGDLSLIAEEGRMARAIRAISGVEGDADA
jgi:pimeloyl-ACP methyl ester carboxylesterase